MKDSPNILNSYLNYMEAIRGTSSNTAKEYFFDLRTFLRFTVKNKDNNLFDTPLEEVKINNVDINFLNSIKINDLHDYISFVDKYLDNNNNTKSRKIASLRSFFNYLHSRVNLIDHNPAQSLESPKNKNRLPVYLTLEESKRLLSVVLENKNELYRKRDYAIIMLFLNCGLRLSELVNISISKIKKDTLTIIGKGNKERTVYLNKACIDAINDYLSVRPKNSKDPDALFLSMRKSRISNRAIQHMIDKYLQSAGFDTNIYSTHKLRHTAATLMYKHGNVDIRTLQHILGHENVSTTQIYTHLDDEILRKAVNTNPLSNFKNDKKIE